MYTGVYMYTYTHMHMVLHWRSLMLKTRRKGRNERRHQPKAPSPSIVFFAFSRPPARTGAAVVGNYLWHFVCIYIYISWLLVEQTKYIMSY